MPPIKFKWKKLEWIETNLMEARSMFVKTRKYCKSKLCSNKYFSNYLETNQHLTTWIKTQVGPGKNYLILDYERLAVLLLFTVSSVHTSCISINLYRTVANILQRLNYCRINYSWIFRKQNLKGFLDEWITSKKHVIWEKFWKFVSGFFQLDYHY